MGCPKGTGKKAMNMSKYTRIKHSNFEHFLNIMFGYWFNKMGYTKFRIIDTHAGAGEYPDGTKCMIIRFIDKFIAEFSNQGIDLVGSLHEIDDDARKHLWGLISDRNMIKNVRTYADNVRILHNASNDPGLIIYDPNGLSDFEYIHTILERYPNMDIFMHLQPANEQRQVNADGFTPLYQYLQKLNRHFIWMTAKFSKYINVIGTNHHHYALTNNGVFHHTRDKKGATCLSSIRYPTGATKKKPKHKK